MSAVPTYQPSPTDRSTRRPTSPARARYAATPRRQLLRATLLTCLIVLCPALIEAAAPAAITDVTITMLAADASGPITLRLVATEYRPIVAGRLPAIVLSHGAPGDPRARSDYTGKYPILSDVFVDWGFVVLSPVRRGYGKSDGIFAEDYGSCDEPAYLQAGRETARDIEAAVVYLLQRPYVDRERIVLVGQSAGGWGSLAAASRGEVPIRGVVNFAGGRGGKRGNVPNDNCAPDRLVEAAGALGRTTAAPSLWLYTENDQFFGPALSRRMHEAYVARGGRANYHLLPAIGTDGHHLFGLKNGVALWKDKVERFLREIGVLRSR
jgi:dienelactone hydrolase